VFSTIEREGKSQSLSIPCFEILAFKGQVGNVGCLSLTLSIVLRNILWPVQCRAHNANTRQVLPAFSRSTQEWSMRTVKWVECVGHFVPKVELS
jgi:hypothetical protein